MNAASLSRGLLSRIVPSFDKHPAYCEDSMSMYVLMYSGGNVIVNLKPGD